MIRGGDYDVARGEAEVWEGIYDLVRLFARHLIWHGKDPLPPRKVQVQVIEIRAIYRGVTAVASLGYKGPLIVHSDSDTAVGQVNGTKAVDNSKPGASDIRAAIAEVRRLEEWTDLRPIYEYISSGAQSEGGRPRA